MKTRCVSLVVIASTLAFIVSGIACSHAPPTAVRESAASSPSSSAAPKPNIPVSQFLTSVFDPLDEWERTALLQAWKKIPAHENYEIVQDVYGEIAGAYGLALIIADKSLTRSTQFSLIVFIRRPKNKYDLYWIYKNENLSQVALSRASGDIFVNGFREDGSTLSCEIAWSRKDNKWTCISF
ncbi:MAG TPA: hypothetical protein VMZ30_04310 [Pyrinomonadaceae bacterium]|nr:hypothetical protein [Pyrinomonadaceae bacterium]